jgi:predicted DsbA family dithiol-disulfide isomerase
VRWLPFQLNPDLPTAGMPSQEYLERKFGPGHAHSYARVTDVGREVGIDFAFDRITVQPNTLDGHRLT